MKRKNPLSENATKGDLLLLKSDLENKLNDLEQKIDRKLETMREEHKQYKDEVLTKLDDISGQLQNLQEDKILSIHQTEELQGQVDNHEKRITHLEKLQQTA